MFFLTPSERKVFVFLGVLIFCGAVLRLFNVRINEQPKSPSVMSAAHPEAFPININTANLTDLEKIPGIGPELASRIIIYRTNHGFFSSFEDLKKVKGIGDKKLKVMNDCIALDNK